MAKKTKKELDEITTAKIENVVKKPVDDIRTVTVGAVKFTIEKYVL